MTATTQTCRTCRRELPLTAFPLRTDGDSAPGARRGVCSRCQSGASGVRHVTLGPAPVEDAARLSVGDYRALLRERVRGRE